MPWPLFWFHTNNFLIHVDLLFTSYWISHFHVHMMMHVLIRSKKDGIILLITHHPFYFASISLNGGTLVSISIQMNYFFHPSSIFKGYSLSINKTCLLDATSQFLVWIKLKKITNIIITLKVPYYLYNEIIF